MIEVRPVPAPATRPLRQRVLRPHQTLEELAHPWEALPGTGSFAAFVDGVMVGTAVVFPESRPGSTSAGPWRLVALAVDPAHRRRGVGAALLEECRDHVRSNGGDEVWCHARLGVVGFYEDAGFVVEGEEWSEDHTGPHVLMWRRA